MTALSAEDAGKECDTWQKLVSESSQGKVQDLRVRNAIAEASIRVRNKRRRDGIHKGRLEIGIITGYIHHYERIMKDTLRGDENT